jgi:hypothetical protein
MDGACALFDGQRSKTQRAISMDRPVGGSRWYRRVVLASIRCHCRLPGNREGARFAAGTELRKLDDGTRTAMMFEGAEGKRLNYKQPAAGGARSMESRMGAASAAFMADAWTEAGILETLPSVSKPSPKCLQNRGGFQRNGAND